jgi:hypothetical protein
MKGSRFNEEQIIGVLRSMKPGQRPKRCADATGFQARRCTSMDGSPVARRFQVLF